MINRLSKLRSQMKLKGFDGVIISSIPNILYLTNFAGFSNNERGAFLIIVAKPQGPMHEYILTDGRYSNAVKNNLKNFELLEISPKLTFEKALKSLAKKHKIKLLGIEEDDLTISEYKKISKHYNTALYYSINKFRSIKDPDEVLAIESACKLGDQTFTHILNKIKLGISEKELAFAIEFFIKKQGAEVSFPPIVAFGANSAIPHHRTRDQRLKTKDQILLDFGVRMNNYCSDMTRTVFFGSPNAELKKIYNTVLEAQKLAIESITSDGADEGARLLDRRGGSPEAVVGHDSSEVDRIARDYIVSKGYPTIPHSLGHGIGLEVHEAPKLSPNSKDILKPGMVFTIEPGIYIPGFGGVRIEDVVLLDKNYLRVLSKSPRALIKL